MEYRFIDKDPVIDLIRTAVYNDGRPEREIAVAAYINPSTLTKLLYGSTKRPQHRTVGSLFEALKIEQRYIYRDSGKTLKVAAEIWRQFVKKNSKRTKGNGK